MSPPASLRPQRDGGDPLRAADRLPVERVGRNRDLFVCLGISQISRVARCWRFPQVLAPGTPGLRRCEGHRLELAFAGRRDDQGPARGGKRTGPNPTDRGKDGTKRSLLTDGAGVPVGLTIDGANRNDHKLMAETIASIPVDRPRPTRKHPQGLCLDKGYDYPEARSVGTESGFTLHLRSRGEEKKELECKPGVKARRWVVERTHGWMNRFRRILVRWEIREDTYFAMLHFVCGIVAWRASGLLK